MVETEPMRRRHHVDGQNSDRVTVPKER